MLVFADTAKEIVREVFSQTFGRKLPAIERHGEVASYDFSKVIRSGDRTYIPLFLEGYESDYPDLILDVIKKFAALHSLRVTSWKLAAHDDAYRTREEDVVPLVAGIWVDHKSIRRKAIALLPNASCEPVPLPTTAKAG